MDEKFWEDGVKVIDHEETVYASRGDRLIADVLVGPLFYFAAFGFPILWLMIGDAKIVVAGILFGSLPFGLVLLLFYGLYTNLQSDHTVRINSVNGTIEEIITMKEKVKHTAYPLKEVMRISLSDPFGGDEYGSGAYFISIKGMNIRGVKWSVDITPFHRELYKQGKPSADRKRIAAIKTAERYAEMLDVEIGSWLILSSVSRDLRNEFGTEWVHKWSDRHTITEQNRRLLDEENKQRQKVQ